MEEVIQGIGESQGESKLFTERMPVTAWGQKQGLHGGCGPLAFGLGAPAGLHPIVILQLKDVCLSLEY